jgi:galactose mutarotase-like enzyme
MTTRVTAGITRYEMRGWEIIRLTTAQAAVDLVPGKGSDILALRWRPRDLNLLWTSPWGLRQRNAPSVAGDSNTAFLDQYPGGWQTIFPNGGSGCTVDGTELGFHGEACLSDWTWAVLEEGDRPSVRLTTRLRRSPFELEKVVSLTEATLHVTETATNVGAARVDAMWSHHPAFGAPFLSGSCRLDAGARTFVADDERDTETGDLQPGRSSDWPYGIDRQGGRVDLRQLPPDGPALDRFGYLTDFEEGWATFTNAEVGLAVRLTWDASVMAHAWLWIEARATQSYPWYRQAYVAAVEPATSWPGQGLAAVRSKTGNQIAFKPGDRKEVHIACEMSEL